MDMIVWVEYVLSLLRKCFIRRPVGRISTRRGQAGAVNPLRINDGKYALGGLEIRPTDACSQAF